MCNNKKEKLGTVQIFGDQFRMLVIRGWIIVDTQIEVDYELKKLNDYLQKEEK